MPVLIIKSILVLVMQDLCSMHLWKHSSYVNLVCVIVFNHLQELWEELISGDTSLAHVCHPLEYIREG